MKINDIELFASSIVNSSSTEMTVEEKLELFIKAMTVAKENNDKQPKDSVRAFKGGL